MAESPIAAFLQALDRLDADAAAALFAPGGRLLCVDGQRAQGNEAVRRLLGEFVAALRSTTHRVTAEWHEDDVWIAEVDAGYELQDWLELKDLPRAVVLRDGPAGIADLRIYGAHERRLAEHGDGEGGMLVGGRWVPPL